MMTTTNSLFALIQVQLLQVSLLILIVGALSYLLKNRHPHIIFALWAVVFVKCLTPPVMVTPIGLFAWQDPHTSHQDQTVLFEPVIGQPFAGVTESDCNSEAHIVSRTDLEETSSGLESRNCECDLDGQRNAGGEAIASDESMDFTAVEKSKPARDSGLASAAAGAPIELVGNLTRHSSVSPVSGQPINVPLLLLLICIAGMIAILTFVARQWTRGWLAIRRSRVESSPELKRVLANVKQKLGFRRSVRVVVNSGGFGPMVFGYFRPVLVLPDDVVIGRSAKEVEPVIAHELIHVRRGDTLLCMLQFVAQTIWWFNPLVWLASRHANRVCEQCCDLEVVSGLECKPTDYARTLLGIVELRRSLKGLAASAGIRSADVTVSRLKWLISRPVRFGSSGVLANAWTNWLIAIVSAVLVFPAGGITGTQELPLGERSRSLSTQEGNQKTEYDAGLAFEGRRWEEASILYEKVVKANPKAGMAWFRLGYALHAQGKLDEAIVAHQRASEYPRTKSTALYNWACALCLKGEHEAALEKLAEALDSGFALAQPIAEDRDFESLKDHPEFKKLAVRHKEQMEAAALVRKNSLGIIAVDSSSSDPQPVTIVGRSANRQLDFCIGKWQIESRNSEPIGDTVITRQENGHIIHEAWNGANGSSGQSYNYYDPAANTWIQNRINSGGAVVKLAGTFDEDGALRLNGTATLPNGSTAKCRVVIQKQNEEHWTRTLEISKDDGVTWELRFDGSYKKILASR